MKTYVGIDPGLSGAIATIRGDNVDIYDIPTLKVGKKTEVNIPALWEIFIDASGPGAICGIEKVHAMPKQGVTSMFTFGFCNGIILTMASVKEWIIHRPTPQSWKKSVMAGMDKGKGAAILKAIELFPQCSHLLTRVKDHNRADALLIAEYIRRTSVG